MAARGSLTIVGGLSNTRVIVTAGSKSKERPSKAPTANVFLDGEQVPFESLYADNGPVTLLHKGNRHVLTIEPSRIVSARSCVIEVKMPAGWDLRVQDQHPYRGRGSNKSNIEKLSLAGGDFGRIDVTANDTAFNVGGHRGQEAITTGSANVDVSKGMVQWFPPIKNDTIMRTDGTVHVNMVANGALTIKSNGGNVQIGNVFSACNILPPDANGSGPKHVFINNLDPQPGTSMTITGEEVRVYRPADVPQDEWRERITFISDKLLLRDGANTVHETDGDPLAVSIDRIDALRAEMLAPPPVRKGEPQSPSGSAG